MAEPMDTGTAPAAAAGTGAAAAPCQPGWYRVTVNRCTFDLPQRYQNLVSVGHGAFGQVVSADDALTNKRVAIKKVHRPFQSPAHAIRTYRELKLLQFMSHENIIGLLDLFSPATTPEEINELYFVTDLMGADLNVIIKTQHLSEEHVRFIVYQVLRGLKYIHSAGIVHRDLKPSNLAVNENCDLKILDFGLARTQEPEMTGYVATRWYRSPEIMLNWTHYGRELDIWSVGCIMAELLTRQPLFPGTDHVNQLNLITEKLGTPSEDVIRRIESETARRYVQSLPQRRGTPMEALVPGASPPAIDLLKKMLEFDTLARWNVDQCLAHPYFQGLHDPNDEPTSATVFDSSFDAVGYTAERIRDLTMTELLSYKRD